MEVVPKPPKAARCPALNVPKLMAVVLLYELLPENTTVPVLPVLPTVNAPLPLTTKGTVTVVLVAAAIVPEVVTVMGASI